MSQAKTINRFIKITKIFGRSFSDITSFKFFIQQEIDDLNKLRIHSSRLITIEVEDIDSVKEVTGCLENGHFISETKESSNLITSLCTVKGSEHPEVFDRYFKNYDDEYSELCEIMIIYDPESLLIEQIYIRKV